MRNFGGCTGTTQKLPKGQDPNQQKFLGVFMMQIHLTGECLGKRGLRGTPQKKSPIRKCFPGFSGEVPQVAVLWSKGARLHLKMAGELWVRHRVPMPVRMKKARR